MLCAVMSCYCALLATGKYVNVVRLKPTRSLHMWLLYCLLLLKIVLSKPALVIDSRTWSQPSSCLPLLIQGYDVDTQAAFNTSVWRPTPLGWAWGRKTACMAGTRRQSLPWFFAVMAEEQAFPNPWDHCQGSWEAARLGERLKNQFPAIGRVGRSRLGTSCEFGLVLQPEILLNRASLVVQTVDKVR